MKDLSKSTGSFRDIVNLWYRDNVQNLKTCFVFESIGQMKKNLIYKIVLPFNFTIVWETLV